MDVTKPNSQSELNNPQVVSKWVDYDSWNFRNLKVTEVWIQPLLSWLGQQPFFNNNCLVLDFGCGVFDLGMGLQNSALVVDGYDPNKKAIEVAQAQIPKSSSTRFFIQETDIPQKKYDLIIVNSVLQYLENEKAVQQLLCRLPSYLNQEKETHIVLSDLIPKNYSATKDALESLTYALKKGVFLPLFLQLFKSASKPSDMTLLQISETDLANMALEADMNCQILSENLTPSKQRYSALLTYHGGRKSE